MYDAANDNGGSVRIERRQIRRLRTLLGGKLLSLTNSVAGDCTIRNLTRGGAKISGSAFDCLPQDPVLVVTKAGLAHETTPVWSRSGEIGVRFQATHDLNTGASPRLAHIHRVWIESLPR